MTEVRLLNTKNIISLVFLRMTFGAKIIAVKLKAFVYLTELRLDGITDVICQGVITVKAAKQAAISACKSSKVIVKAIASLAETWEIVVQVILRIAEAKNIALLVVMCPAEAEEVVIEAVFWFVVEPWQIVAKAIILLSCVESKVILITEQVIV